MNKYFSPVTQKLLQKYKNKSLEETLILNTAEKKLLQNAYSYIDSILANNEYTKHQIYKKCLPFQKLCEEIKKLKPKKMETLYVCYGHAIAYIFSEIEKHPKEIKNLQRDILSILIINPLDNDLFLYVYTNMMNCTRNKDYKNHILYEVFPQFKELTDCINKTISKKIWKKDELGDWMLDEKYPLINTFDVFRFCMTSIFINLQY